MEKISIIIPAYNEEKRIAGTLEAYGNFFNHLQKNKIMDYELLVVINNTSDNTEQIVKSYKLKNKNIRYLNFKQGGKGFAITEGFKDALKRDNSLVGFVDADMSTSPEAFYDLAKNINGYSGIIASRYIKGSRVKPKQTAQRIIASRFFNVMVRLLFFLTYRDTQCGAKIFRKKSLEKILPQIGITQWAFDIDLLYRMKKAGFRVREFPTVWSDNEASKINLKKASIQMFFAVFQLRINNSPFRRLLRPVKPIVKLIWELVK